MLMVLAGQTVESEGFFDRLLDPVDELPVAIAPSDDPGGKVATSFLDISPVVKPAELLQAVVVGFAREMVQSVAEEVHIAPLDGRLGEDLAEAERRPA